MLIADYFWALSELIDSAKEVRNRADLRDDALMVVDHDSRLVAVTRASGSSTPWQASTVSDDQLRRPAALFPEWRLDRLLQRKAEEGVRIYVMVYKEVTASMALSSKHTKHALEDLHENIACMRHPDHSGGESIDFLHWDDSRVLNVGELVYYFSHHEKLCVVDNKLAAMGGLDACYGRWDTHNHPLADVHPTEFFKSLFPGQGEK